MRDGFVAEPVEQSDHFGLELRALSLECVRQTENNVEMCDPCSGSQKDARSPFRVRTRSIGIFAAHDPIERPSKNVGWNFHARPGVGGFNFCNCHRTREPPSVEMPMIFPFRPKLPNCGCSFTISSTMPLLAIRDKDSPRLSLSFTCAGDFPSNKFAGAPFRACVRTSS